MVKLWVANTDPDWFDFLAGQPDIDEVNFWQPSGGTQFGAIQPGELFLFKLKSPRNAIGGFGVLDRANNYPLSLAWEALGIKNGARTLQEMRERVGKYRSDARLGLDYTIGCRIVVQPVFFPRELWIPQPESWSRQIVTGKAYDTAEREGRVLWDRLMEAAQAAQGAARLHDARVPFLAQGERYGPPRLVTPRRGQGAFRLAVTDAYGRQCAISGGKVLPALDAAHIRSYADGGEHDVANGLLLRRDIHSVFDAGYITFDDELKMVVSDAVRTVFNNGNEYRRLHGQKLRAPDDPGLRPSVEHLRWHQSERFERFVA
jgi:putative restriction endonuclease